jgi:serine phosphatase RsbU (regulator of sigma subunit)
MSAPLTLIRVRPQHIDTEAEAAERRRATRVQHCLLPTKFPHCAGYRFSAYWRPLHGPGGDFYDVFRLSGGRIGFYLADVSGHDTAAALVTVWLRQLMVEMRMHSVGVALSPGRTFRALQARMEADGLGERFVTMVYGVLDPAMGTLIYAAAGHPQPMRANDSRVSPLSGASGPILSGLWPQTNGWPEARVPLRPGDRVVVYSDGVTDARRRDGRRLGAGGLAQLWASLPSGADEASALAEGILGYARGGAVDDDLAVLALNAPGRNARAA